MGLSGFIFLGLAVSWAVYLIPKALQHHDEVARTRSIDRFSTAIRVLARREPVNRRDARLVVTPQRSRTNPRVLVPSVAVASTAPSSRPSTPERSASALVAETGPPAATPESQRLAARAAARRRRRILVFLLLCDVAVVAAAAYAVLPWWAVAVPATLTLLYLVLCRTQVGRQSRREDRARASVAEPGRPSDEDLVVVAQESLSVAVVPRRAVRVEAQDSIPRPMARGEYADPSTPGSWDAEDDDTVSMPAVVDVAVASTPGGGTMWDPLPMTLPTYVTKPKVKRTVRTIDLGEPGTWSSGRSVEDSRLAAESVGADAPPEQASGRRAVGD